MLAPTHSVFSIFLTLSILAVFGIKLSLHWTILVCAVLGALLPDIDIPKSFIGRIFFFISKPIERRYGHRTITHSLLGWFMASLLFALVLAIIYFAIAKTRLGLSLPMHIMPYVSLALIKRWLAAFSIGYLSHLILDMFNPRGVQMFYPEQGRDVIPGNIKFRPESGAKIELVIFLILCAGMLLSLPISKYGIKTSLRWLLATPEATIQEFKELKTRLFVEFEGTLQETKEPISGLAEVLDVENKKLIIFVRRPKSEVRGQKDKTKDFGRIYTLSDELASDIVASKVRLKKTDELIKIEQKKFMDESRENLLRQFPENALVSGIVHLPKGLEIRFPADADTKSGIHTIQQVGDDLILRFASRQQIEALGLAESYKLREKKDETELRQLTNELNRLKYQIRKTRLDENLTPLGREVLLTEDERAKQNQKIEELTQKIEEKELRLEELRLQISNRRFVFSVDVTIRYLD